MRRSGRALVEHLRQPRARGSVLEHVYDLTVSHRQFLARKSLRIKKTWHVRLWTNEHLRTVVPGQAGRTAGCDAWTPLSSARQCSSPATTATPSRATQPVLST